MMPHHVIVIDDDIERTHALRQQLSDSASYMIDAVHNLNSVVDSPEAPPDIVLACMSAIDASTEAALQYLQEHLPDATVLLSHAPNDPRRIVQLVRDGAHDYLTVDASTASDCASAIRQAGEARRQHSASRPGSVFVVQSTDNAKLVGTSQAMQEVFDRIGTASKTDMSVVVRGESGTGKELVARTIHAQSARRDNPLYVVNCRTVSAEALETVIDGERPGTAYANDTADDRPGVRTVILDHVGQLSVDAQATLNHSLKYQHALSPSGDRDPSEIARVIGLTRGHLRSAVQRKEFCKDLYFRLATFPIRVPPLRDRDGDVLQLARHFLDQHVAQSPNLEDATLTEDAKTVLQSYCWPGNVRELLNVMERAVHTADTTAARAKVDTDNLMINPDDPVHRPLLAPSTSANTDSDASSTHEGTPRDEAARDEAAPGEPQPDGNASTAGAADTLTENPQQHDVPLGTEERQILPLEELKRRAVERAYTLCNGDVDHAAVELDIGRSTMYRMLKRYDIRDHE